MTIGLFLKEGGYYEVSNTNYYLVSVLIIIVSMQIGALIGVFTMCFLQINKGNSKFDNK